MAGAMLLAVQDATENLSISIPFRPRRNQSVRSRSSSWADHRPDLRDRRGILFTSLFVSRGPPKGGAEPPQVYGSTPIEIAWTAAPALVVFVLILASAHALGSERRSA